MMSRRSALTSSNAGLIWRRENSPPREAGESGGVRRSGPLPLVSTCDSATDVIDNPEKLPGVVFMFTHIITRGRFGAPLTAVLLLAIFAPAHAQSTTTLQGRVVDEHEPCACETQL